MECRPAREATPDGVGRVRAFGSQQAVGAQGVVDVGRHAMAVVGLALRRIPEVVRDEFERQRLGGRPGQGHAGGGDRPGLEIGEVGGERAQGVLAHALASQVLEGLDVAVGQKLGEPVTPIDRQDGGERVELERPAAFPDLIKRSPS